VKVIKLLLKCNNALLLVCYITELVGGYTSYQNQKTIGSCVQYICCLSHRFHSALSCMLSNAT